MIRYILGIVLASSVLFAADEYHDKAEQWLFSLTEEMDSFFGDIRSIESKRKDYFRLGAELRIRESDPARFRQRISANLELDEIAENLRLSLIGNRADQFESGDTLRDSLEDSDFSQDYLGNTASTGIGYDFYKSPFTIVGIDAGVRVRSSKISPFAQLRGSKWFEISDKLAFEPTQFLIWDEDRGFGEKTRGDLIYTLDNQTRLRSRSEGYWSETSRGVDLTQDLSITRKFGERAFMGVGASAFAYTRPSWTVDAYSTSFRYRYNAYSDWLYLELEPGLRFPESRDYETTPFVVIKADVYFEQ